MGGWNLKFTNKDSIGNLLMKYAVSNHLAAITRFWSFITGGQRTSPILLVQESIVFRVH